MTKYWFVYQFLSVQKHVIIYYNTSYILDSQKMILKILIIFKYFATILSTCVFDCYICVYVFEDGAH